MPFPIQMRRSAQKYFQHLDQTTQKRIRLKLTSIAIDPYDIAHSKPLVGNEKRSSRVGDYRILFLVTSDLVLVTDVDGRGDVYKAMKYLISRCSVSTLERGLFRLIFAFRRADSDAK